MNGLTPTSKVLDIGCGVLRAGYWLIHFLEPGSYCGIEPSRERLDVGIRTMLEPQTYAAKRRRFDTNANFDTSVFGETFDYFLAYSIWTHASKSQILVMLDGFLRDSKPDAVFLTTFLPAGWRHPDYQGESWVGTSHESDVSGCIRHSLSWIERECRRRDLSVRVLGHDEAHGQSCSESRGEAGRRVSETSPFDHAGSDDWSASSVGCGCRDDVRRSHQH